MSGRDPTGQALAVPVEPASGLAPSGFDPSRVRVTAADFNGRDWDGSPFSHVPSWLENALRLGAVTIKVDDRDYALWAVETPAGIKVAEPGDDIVCLDGHFDVHKESYLASAIEARRAATAQTDAVHESAVGEAETPNDKGASQEAAK